MQCSKQGEKCGGTVEQYVLHLGGLQQVFMVHSKIVIVCSISFKCNQLIDLKKFPSIHTLISLNQLVFPLAHFVAALSGTDAASPCAVSNTALPAVTLPQPV